MADLVNVPLEIESPMFRCGDCGFTVPIRGAWSTRNGRLTFVADEDLQPGRGPDLEGCREGWNVAHWTHIKADTGQRLDIGALRKE